VSYLFILKKIDIKKNNKMDHQFDDLDFNNTNFENCEKKILSSKKILVFNDKFNYNLVILIQGYNITYKDLDILVNFDRKYSLDKSKIAYSNGYVLLCSKTTNIDNLSCLTIKEIVYDMYYDKTFVPYKGDDLIIPEQDMLLTVSIERIDNNNENKNNTENNNKNIFYELISGNNVIKDRNSEILHSYVDDINVEMENDKNKEHNFYNRSTNTTIL